MQRLFFNNKSNYLSGRRGRVCHVDDPRIFEGPVRKHCDPHRSQESHQPGVAQQAISVAVHLCSRARLGGSSSQRKHRRVAIVRSRAAHRVSAELRYVLLLARDQDQHVKDGSHDPVR